MNNLRKTIAKHADKIGIAGGTLCLIHCLAVPVVAFLSSGLAVGHTHHGWFPGDDYLFIFICMVTVYFAAKSAKNKAIRWVMVGAASVFSISILLTHSWHMHGSIIEYAGHVGALTLIGAHLANIKSTKGKQQCPMPENAAA